MKTQDIVRLRLANQRVSQSKKFSRPDEVVRWLGAVQAQDYPSAMWAVSLRTPGTVKTDVEQAIAERRIIRTWPMRGTLHFVAPGDIRWMLRLLAPRIIAAIAGRRRSLELDEETLGRCSELISRVLAGGQILTRGELCQELERSSVATAGQRGIHILRHLSLEGLLCFGPHRGKEPTFALLEEWVPSADVLGRDDALAELTRRYFSSHGPATVQDFGWWSGLTAADMRRGLELAGADLVPEKMESQIYWRSEKAFDTLPAPTACLLPAFDEYLLGYKDRSAVLDPAHSQKIVPGSNGMFLPVIVLNGRVAGTWKRTAKPHSVRIELNPFQPLSKSDLEAAAASAEAYGKFIGLPPELN